MKDEMVGIPDDDGPVLEMVGALKVDPEVVLTVLWCLGWPRKPQK